MDSAHDRIFEELVHRHRQALTGAAYHLCGDWEAACDLVQETLLDAYRGLATLRDPQKAVAWLFTILRRKVFAYRRSRPREVELTEEPAIPAPDDNVESMVREIIIERMAVLAKEDREILAGKYLLGLSYQELAQALEINEGTVRVRCFRAKEKLRDVLRNAGIPVPKSKVPSQAHSGGERHDV